MSQSKSYIPKWHRELELFSQIKPVILLDGNILDVYQYPVEGSLPKGSIVRLPDYLYYFYKDRGYEDIIFYDNLEGFSNPFDSAMVQKFGSLFQSHDYNGIIQAPFLGDKARRSRADDCQSPGTEQNGDGHHPEYGIPLYIFAGFAVAG